MSETILAKCSNKECDFSEEFEPDEFGLNYYQAIGECPWCGWKTIYENGELTQVEIQIKLTNE